MAKTINTRMSQKHDTEAHWKLAINFIPLKGELIIYDVDENNPNERIKIGNGVDNVNNLEFFTGDYSNLPVIKGEGESSVKIDASYEGVNNAANGAGSVAMGGGTVSKSDGAHTEGILTTAGRLTQAETVDTNKVISTIGPAATEIGMDFATAADIQAATVGLGGFGAHAEGMNTQALGSGAHAEGSNTIAFANSSHAEGDATVAKGQVAHAEGWNTKATGNQSHAEGSSTTAEGNEAHAEGKNTNASGQGSHTEGNNTEATGRAAHAEGEYTIASGNLSHAEGGGDEKSGKTEASGWCSHAEGWVTKAQGDYSHAEGYHTQASSPASHASGKGTVANGEGQTVVGRYNYYDKSTQYEALFVVGNGTSDTNRSNAFWVNKDGTTSLHQVIDEKIAAIEGKSKSLVLLERLDDGYNKILSLEDGNYIVGTAITASIRYGETINEDTYWRERTLELSRGDIIFIYKDPCYVYDGPGPDYYDLTFTLISGNKITRITAVYYEENYIPQLRLTETTSANSNTIFSELNESTNLTRLEPGAYVVANAITGSVPHYSYNDDTGEETTDGTSIDLVAGDLVYCEREFYSEDTTFYYVIIRIQSVNYNRFIQVEDSGGMGYQDPYTVYLTFDRIYEIAAPKVIPTDYEVISDGVELSLEDGIYTLVSESSECSFTFGDKYTGDWHEQFDEETGEDTSYYDLLYLPTGSIIIANSYSVYDYTYTNYNIMTPNGGTINLQKTEHQGDTTYTEVFNSNNQITFEVTYDDGTTSSFKVMASK